MFLIRGLHNIPLYLIDVYRYNNIGMMGYISLNVRCRKMPIFNNIPVRNTLNELNLPQSDKTIFKTERLNGMHPRVLKYSGDPVSDRLTKWTIPEYGPPIFSPKFVPIHIMYYYIQKANRPAIRDRDHPFSVPNHKRTRRTDQPQQQKKITLLQLYKHQLRDQLWLESLMGPAVAGSTKGPALA